METKKAAALYWWHGLHRKGGRPRLQPPPRCRTMPGVQACDPQLLSDNGRTMAGRMIRKGRLTMADLAGVPGVSTISATPGAIRRAQARDSRQIGHGQSTLPDHSP